MEMCNTPLETTNAAADQVPADVPNLPPRKGSEELAEGREHCVVLGKAQADVFNPAESCRGSGAPGLAGLRGSLGKRKGPSKHSSVGQ